MSIDFWMTSRDGVPWNKAPLPRRFHHCRTQSIGGYNGNNVGRCACGATRWNGQWIGKNETRKMRKRYGKVS